MSVAERRGDLPQVAEAAFRKFVERVGSLEKAARILYAENYHFRRRLKLHDEPLKQRAEPMDLDPASPYRNPRR